MAVTTTNPGSRATARYLHVSPYKVRQVLELIRGLPVDDAVRLLQLSQKDAADYVLKVLLSASANAEANHSIPSDELFVSRAWADEGPTRKWGQPRARGRYFRIRHRTTHLTIVLERFDVDELEERRRRDEASGRGAAVAQRRRAERVRRSRAAQAEGTDEAENAEDVEEASIIEEEVAAAEGEGIDVDEALAVAEAEAEDEQ
jgi:large subunit ribosomal protein L22